MKLLILFIYSDNEIYRQMVEVQRSYVNKFANVTSYFIEMRENQEKNIEIVNDFIYVKGEERVFNILHKTIESLEYMLQSAIYYDFIIRTNVSTILNIPRLLRQLGLYPKSNIYTSGMVNTLCRLDPNFGIKDNSLIGTKFASGTSIILSNDVAHNIIKNKTKLRYDIIDDVSIAIYIKTYLPEIYKNINIYKLITDSTKRLLEPKDVNLNAFFFRNRINNNIEKRSEDITNMIIVCSVYFRGRNIAA